MTLQLLHSEFLNFLVYEENFNFFFISVGLTQYIYSPIFVSLRPENNSGFSTYVIDFFITEEIFEAV
jgi:hypothetical protein